MVALTYVVTTICMAFTAFSYVRMTKAYPVAGSVYTFVQKSINPHLGFLSGWVILIGYMFLPMLNYLVSAMYLSSAIPQVPEWVWIIAMIAIVTIVNHFGIKITDIFNKGIVWIQIIFLVVFVIITLKYILGGGGAGTLLDMSSFVNTTELVKEGMGVPVLFSGASILALSYLGFDAISTLSEEAVNPEKNIGRAIMISCIGAGFVFVILTYFLQVAWPTAWTDMADPDNSYEIIMRIAGSGTDIIRYLVAPLLGAAFTFAIWVSLDFKSMLLGFGWLLVGLIYLAWTAAA